MKFSMSRIALLSGVASLVLVIAVTGYLASRGGSGTRATGAGGAAIGGPFTLVDQNGRTVRDTDFRGRSMLIYFGYTYCPDVCPTALTTMSDVVRALGPVGEKVVPVFVTVDPKRDTAEHLKLYVSYFHPRMVGLTGSGEQVGAAAKAFRVYATKVADKAATKSGDDDSYSMDHTSIIYLMGPGGAFLTYFDHGTATEEMVQRIRALL